MLMLLRDTRNLMQKCSCFPSPSLMTLAAGERERSKSNRLPSLLFLRRRAKAAQTSFFIPPSSPLLLLNSHSPSTAFVWISWNGGGGGGGERSACCRFPYFYFHPTVRSSEKVYRSYVKKGSFALAPSTEYSSKHSAIYLHGYIIINLEA